MPQTISDITIYHHQCGANHAQMIGLWQGFPSDWDQVVPVPDSNSSNSMLGLVAAAVAPWRHAVTSMGGPPQLPKTEILWDFGTYPLVI